MAKRFISRKEAMKATDLFRMHLAPSEREGFFKYLGDWSDAKVAAEIAPDLQATAIGNLRTDLFGKLDTSQNAIREDNGKLKEIQTLVQNLLSCYGELEVKYNKLVDTMALNRVVPTNILHLKTTCKEEKK